jgi:hypothetical protein
METSEPSVHSFIVKIWVEEPSAGEGRTKWRGHIVHVPGGERRYLKALDEIANFIMPYLEEMNADFGPRARLRRWLKVRLRNFTPGGPKLF